MPIGNSTPHRARQRMHQARRTGARRVVRQQVAEDGPGRVAPPSERCGQTLERQVPRGEPTGHGVACAPRIVAGAALTSRVSAEPALDGADLECDACDEARRPALEIAEVIRRFGAEYRRQVGGQLTVQQDRVLRELLVCRTEVLGAHYWSCEVCGQQVELCHSCHNRHCPKCGAAARRRWADRVQADLLPIEYHHMVVTLPRPLTLLAFDHPRVLYPLVLRAGAEAILQLARRELGVELGVLILLHTWGQLMNRHVHGHCLVSGGGLSLDGARCLLFPSGACLSLEQLAREFRDLFLDRLDALHRRGKLVLQGDWRQLDWGHGWQEFLEPLREIDWVVFSRGVWDRREEAGQRGGVARAVEYLARYANRVAMSNSRLVAIQGEEVLFRYRDHRAGGVWRTTSLPGVEFLERFLWHVLPKGLRRTRRFGWWGNAVRTEKLTLLRRLLGVPPAEPREPADTATDTLPEDMPEETPDEELLRLEAEQRAPRKCRVCGGKLELLYQTGRPTVAELLRMPPSMELRVETGRVQLHLPISAFL